MTKDISTVTLSRYFTLHLAFHSLKTFIQVFLLLEVLWFLFLPLRLASSPSDNVGDIAEKVGGNGKHLANIRR